MVELQILSKVLNTKDISILTDNYLTEEYFPSYTDEYSFIKDHYERYGVVPDIESFLSRFDTFERVSVNETDRYLVETIREEHLYSQSVPVIKKSAELLKANANDAVRYLQSEIDTLQPNYSIPTVDIAHSKERADIFDDKATHKDKWFIPTGFEELDEVIGGWQRGEEFGVVFARTGNCKSWVIIKMAAHAWKIGKVPGYISPEMSAVKIGYRFDTVEGHLSNSALNRGLQNMLSSEDYRAYLDEVGTHSNAFYVSTPQDFNNDITVTKLKNWVQSNKIDILFIDGITYLKDERYKKGDNKTTSLTNISEDLMQLSCKLHIPIIVVVQSNRGGVDKETPELEDIRDSDGISHNATKVISVRHKEEYLTMVVKKNRDFIAGTKLEYLADIDTGNYTFVENHDEEVSNNIKHDEPVKQADSKPKKKVVF